MSQHPILCALVVASMSLPVWAQGGRSVPVSIQPATAVEVILFATGGDGKLLTTTDQNGKGSFDGSGLTSLGSLTINEETCKARRRVLLVASTAKAPQNRDCRITQIGTSLPPKTWCSTPGYRVASRQQLERCPFLILRKRHRQQR